MNIHTKQNSFTARDEHLVHQIVLCLVIDLKIILFELNSILAQQTRVM